MKDEPLEVIQDQYEQKNMVLAQFGEEVSAWTLYEDIYDDLDTVVPVVVIDESDEDTKHVVQMSVAEAVEQAEHRNDMLLGGSVYFKAFISKVTAKEIRAFIVDMDNVYAGTLLSALRAEWRTANAEEIPMPTYIVNSGTGLHLYYVLDTPLPCLRRNAEMIDQLYRRLAVLNTTKRVYLVRQVQWFGQDFRIAGGLNKYNWTNTIYQVGGRWNAVALGNAVGLKNVEFAQCGDPPKKPPREKLSKGRVLAREGWRTNRAFYDYTLRTCREKTKEGNRYMSMCALTVIAWKCNVPVDEVERDLLSLIPDYNKNATRKIKPREVKSALKMYNEKAMLTQRERLQDWIGWEYKPIKRNGRKQEVHLRGARAIQQITDEADGTNWREGNGRPSAYEKVKAWRIANSMGRKADCIRDTGLSKPTVYKWWDWEAVEAQRLKEEGEGYLWTESEIMANPGFVEECCRRGIRLNVVSDDEYEVLMMERYLQEKPWKKRKS